MFAPRSVDAVEAADLVTDGDQSLMDVPLAVLEPGAASFTVIERCQPGLKPTSGPGVGGTGARLGDRRWCVLMGRLAGFGLPRSISLVS